MNRYALFAFSLFVIWGIAYATGCDITLPVAPVLVEPDTTPVPNGREVISTLRADEWYVIESTVELIALQSPGGLVTIDCDNGPVMLRGKFADGTGKIERRKYTSPFVYSVSGVKAGKFELILIPTGVALESAIVRQCLTVEDGTKPIPPPGPGPGPEPAPKAKTVSLAIVEDTMNRSPDMAITMNGLVAWTAFVDAGNDWRSYDLTTGEARGKKAITDLNGPSPGLVVYDKATSKMIHRGNMPATIGELKTLIRGLTGG